MCVYIYIKKNFWRFQVFVVVYHRAPSKTGNPWKILFLFYDVRFFLDIIY